MSHCRSNVEKKRINLFFSYPLKYSADEAVGRVGKIRGYSARLSRIIALLFNALMTKRNFLRLLGKKSWKTTIFLRDAEIYVEYARQKLSALYLDNITNVLNNKEKHTIVANKIWIGVARTLCYKILVSRCCDLGCKSRRIR